MERFLVFFFIDLCLVLWIIELVLRKDSLNRNEWSGRTCRSVLLLAPLLLDVLRPGEDLPAFVMTADLLVFTAVYLLSFGRNVAWLSAVGWAVAGAGLVRSVAETAGCRLPFDAATAATLVAALLPAVSAVSDSVSFPSGRGAAHVSKVLYHLRILVAPSLVFVAAATLALGLGGYHFSRAALLVLSLVLCVLYTFLFVSGTFGKKVVQQAVRPGVNAMVKDMDESQKMDMLFKRIEDYMQKDRPYLDDSFTLSDLAAEMLTNKGMLSKTINEKAGRNFCQYVNSYRIRYAVSVMNQDRRVRVAELTLMSGFHSVASFNMAFKLYMNDTPSEYLRTLQVMDALRAKAEAAKGSDKVIDPAP